MQVPTELMGQLEQQVHVVQQAKQAHRVPLEFVDQLAQMEQTAQTAQLALVVQQVKQVAQVPQAQEVLLVQMVLTDQLEQQVHVV
jgi:hypothetical protein